MLSGVESGSEKGCMTQKCNNNGKEFALKTVALGRQGWGTRIMEAIIAGRAAVNAWQSDIPFYSKSPGQKLAEIERAFGFKIDPSTVEDHEGLASLRWELQSHIGKSNLCSTRALAKLFFSYVKFGPRLLHDRALIAATMADLVAEFGGIGGIDAADNASARSLQGSLETLDAATVNEPMGRYHFLGYGRGEGLHLGLRSREGTGTPLAVATFSAWDIDHADLALRQLGVDRSEVLVLARLLSVSGGRITLSQFIAQLVRWVRRELPHIKIITTYCNPNAGHYGTVYRGANFLPLCAEEHPFIPFHDGEYISPRKLTALCDAEGTEHCKRVIRPSAVKPIPLLLYYYPVRLGRKARQIQVMTCRHPYPFDLPIPIAEDGKTRTCRQR
jgi:hypothetical protein